MLKKSRLNGTEADIRDHEQCIDCQHYADGWDNKGICGILFRYTGNDYVQCEVMRWYWCDKFEGKE